MTAQAFETGARFLEGGEGARRIVLRFGDQAEHEIRLIAENRRLHLRGFSERQPANAFGRAGIAGVELELREEELAQNRLAGRRRLRKKLERLLAQPLGLEVSAVSIEHERLVEI